MAEVLTGALVGSLVDKLLSQVLRSASLALQHNKHWEALHTLLSRLQPLAASICSTLDDHGGGSAVQPSSSTRAAMHNWLQSLYKELQEAEEILQRSSSSTSRSSNMNVMKRISNSEEILRVTGRIKSLVEEAGLLGPVFIQNAQSSLQSSLELISAQMTSLQQEVRGLELSHNTRNAFSTPNWNYGYGAGTTISAGRAFAQIKDSADAFMSVHGLNSVGDDATTLVAATKFRRQDSETVFGGAQIVEEMQKLLMSEAEMNRWFGVWATGGAGKTLTAQRIFNSSLVQNHFTGGTFWLTVGRSSSLKMLYHDLFLECTGHLAPMFSSNEDTKNRLCQELSRLEKSVLFLDDVWDPELLDWLDVLPTSGASGNKIFVTTRNVEVLQRKHAVTRKIPALPVEDSWKLFCWHAFRSVVPASLEVVARKVVDECKGLPLALKVVGATFVGKTDLRDWDHALKKLKNAEILSQEHERQLFLRLELSLEDLPSVHPHLKDCFLYFAAFPEDTEVRVVEDLLDIWVGEGIVGSRSHSHNIDPEDEAYELVGWLVARSLIELHSLQTKSYTEQGFLRCKIHDVLRDLARYTLQHNQDAPKRECLYEAGRQLDSFPLDWMTSPFTKRSLFPFQNQLCARRFSLSFNNLTELPQQLNAPHLQVLLLRNNPLSNVPKGFIECLRSLKVLDLRNTSIRDLPSTLGNLKLLAILNLGRCENLEKIPDSIGEIKGLRRLDLSGCKKLSSLPSKLSRLTSLQILNLANSFKVWNNRGTLFNNLFSPRLLLKDLMPLTELRQLSICSLTEDNFSLLFNSFHKIQSLELCFRSLIYLPGVEGLKSLQVLSLEGCWLLKSLPSSIERLTNLTALNLALCKALHTLPALDLLPQLEKLDLSGCEALRELPVSSARAGAFPALRELKMYACDKISEFPALEAGAMPQLALLNLSGWSQLSTLPHSLQQLKSLRTLDAGVCANLQSLDQSLDVLSLSSLEELFLNGTPKLSSLPSALASLPNLRVIDIRRSHASIPDELLQLEAQGQLKISR